MNTITWTAPTTNVDGSPIVGSLNYTMYIDGKAEASFPGSLNPDGNYSHDLTLPSGAYQVTLTAVNETGNESAPSAPVAVNIPFVPNPPVILGISGPGVGLS